jgi:hypothetical protein
MDEPTGAREDLKSSLDSREASSIAVIAQSTPSTRGMAAPQAKPGLTMRVFAVLMLAHLIGALALLHYLAALPADGPPLPLVLNGLGGVVYGWLYWRQGLVAAMVAYFSTDGVLLFLVPLFRLIGIAPTVSHAIDLGYIPVVVADACGSVEEEARRRALADVEYTLMSLTTDADTFCRLLRLSVGRGG